MSIICRPVCVCVRQFPCVMDDQLTEKLREIYRQPNVGLGGVTKLYRAAKQHLPDLNRKQVEEFLTGEESYTLHKPVRRNFERSRIFVRRIGQLWQMDLAQMDGLAHWNDGIKYLLVIIDCFSKQLSVAPLKDKTAASVAKRLSQILQDVDPPECIQSDKGGEFLGAPVIKLLKEKGVKFYQAQNEKKAAIAERVIRTLKGLIYRWLTVSNTFRYIDRLEEFVDNYNHSYHRSIKRSPAEVSAENEEEVAAVLFPPETKPNLDRLTYKFAVGDKVRVTNLAGPFDKGYRANNTMEIFTVHERLRTSPPRYRLADYDGNVIVGSWYEKEMTRVTQPPDPEYKIEKVIKRRTINKEKWVFVKWQGYPSSQNSWVKEAELKRL